MKPSIARIVLFVRDARELAEWYGDVLGLTTKYDGLDEGWIELDTGGSCTLALHTVESPDPTHAEIAFVVDDVEAIRQELVRKGVDMHHEVLTWRHYQYCKGKDPQGNVFQIINAS